MKVPIITVSLSTSNTCTYVNMYTHYFLRNLRSKEQQVADTEFVPRVNNLVPTYF